MKTFYIVDKYGTIHSECESLFIAQFIFNDMFTEKDIKENDLKIISGVQKND